MVMEEESEEMVLDISAMRKELQGGLYDKVCERLFHSARLFIKDRNRMKELEVVIDAVIDILHSGINLIQSQKGTKVVTECFRNLRNACTAHITIQNKLANHRNLLEDTSVIMEMLSSLKCEESALCLQTGVQFLGNLIVKNPTTQNIVWTKYLPLVLKLLQHENHKVANYCSMIIYNILLGCPYFSPTVTANTVQLLIEHAINGCEFASYTVDFLIKQEGYLPSVYNQLKEQHKLYLLDAVYCIVGCKSGVEIKSTESPEIHYSNIIFLSQEFKARSYFILKTVEKYVDEIEPREVSQLLEVIASASGKSYYLTELQKDKSLLIDCTFLLKSIHSLGKEGDNNFTTIQKLSELDLRKQDSTVQSHPAFGFKVGLIRLIGNLCWKNQTNQDQVLELEGIQLLLDCCKIDARNPLQLQWAILAVRNLCDGNKKCQSVVAGMTQRGEIDAATLNQVGLTLHSGPDGGIGIMPLPSE